METHITSQRKFWQVALSLSLGVHILLLTVWGFGRKHHATAPISSQNKHSKSVGRSIVQPTTLTAESLNTPHWLDLSNNGLRSLRSNLEKLGCPDRTVNAILEAAIHLEYDPKFKSLFFTQYGNYWESAARAKTSRPQSRSPEQEKAKEQLEVLINERYTLMRDLAKMDRRQMQFGARRYNDDETAFHLSFLSKEKRQRIAAQSEEARLHLNDLRNQGLSGEEIKSRQSILEAAQDGERSLLLTPEEYEEYKLRTSRYARFASRLYGFAPNIDEHRTMIRLQETFSGNVPEEEYKKLLGEERFLKFKRAQDNDFHSIYKVGSHIDMPEENMIAVYEIRKNTEAAAKRIRENASISRNEREAQLQAIQLQADAALDQYFGEFGRDLYDDNGGMWIKEISRVE